MRYTPVVLSAFAATALAQFPEGYQGDAKVTTNPVGVTYVADFGTTGAVTGTITFTSTNGTGVLVKDAFTINKDASLGPFLYHVHVDPVPADGNCSKTLAHLDPFIRGEATPCDPAAPATCQVGDLSGKHGKPTGGLWEKSYTDLYISTQEGVGAFIGNRSVVVHLANKTRIACANLVRVGGGYGGGYGGGNASATYTTSAPTPTYTGAAASMVAAGKGLLGVGLVAVVAAMF